MTASGSAVESPFSAAALAALRAREFPWAAETIYLNNASTGPIPERTRVELDEFNRLRTTPHRLTDPMLFGMLDESRRLAAQLVNAAPEEIALSANTTWGLNLAAFGLPLRRGDVVVVSDREFPANIYPWLRLRDRGIEVELVPVTAEGWPDEDRLLERVADPRVRLLAIGLVQFSTGWMADLARVSRACRDHDTFLVVDAIQGVGQVPVDLAATPVDVLACGAQKWLLSPWGSGFTYVRRDIIDILEPPMVSWMSFAGTDDFTRLTSYDPTLRPDARRYEFITLPFQAFAGMNRSLELLLELGIGPIRDHLAALRAPLWDWARAQGVRIASPTDHHASGIVALAPRDPAAAHARLREHGVVASLREGAIRLSPHAYTTPDEVARVMELLGG